MTSGRPLSKRPRDYWFQSNQFRYIRFIFGALSNPRIARYMELIPRDGLSVETPRGALGRDHVCAEHLVSLAAESIAIVTTRSQAIGLWKEITLP